MTLQYNLLDRSNEKALGPVKKAGLGIAVMGPVGGGRLGSPSEAIRISQVEQCLSIGRADKARCVVANLQEGTAAARGLADRLKVPMVVFSNFPAMSDEQRNFDAMARANVAALVKALR